MTDQPAAIDPEITAQSQASSTQLGDMLSLTRECPFCLSEISSNSLKCKYCCEWVTAARTTSSADAAELHERRLAEALEARVERHLVKRYSWIALIVAALTGGTATLLVKSTVDGMLADARESLAGAEALQARSLKTLDAIDAALNRMTILETKQATLAKSVADSEQRLRDVQTNSASLRRDQFFTSAEILKLTGDLDKRLSALASVVKSAAPSAARTTNIALAESSNRAAVAAALDRAENRQYPITVTPFANAQSVVNLLVKLGYSAALYDEADDDIDLSASGLVWIGRSVPFDVAINVLRAARQQLPDLRYIAITGENQMKDIGEWDKKIHLGASTKWAAEQGLAPFTDSEFDQLLKTTNTEEFRRLVRQHYGPPTETSGK